MADLFSLKNRIALVTGASRGLGRDMARCLAEAGATGRCAGRVAKDLDATVRAIKRRKGKADAVILDVTNEDSIQSGVRALLRKHRRIDVLVNNAGVIHRENIVDTATPDYRKVIETDLIGPFVLAREIGRLDEDGMAVDRRKANGVDTFEIGRAAVDEQPAESLLAKALDRLRDRGKLRRLAILVVRMWCRLFRFDRRCERKRLLAVLVSGLAQLVDLRKVL